jgi:hypothetical protein
MLAAIPLLNMVFALLLLHQAISRQEQSLPPSRTCPVIIIVRLGFGYQESRSPPTLKLVKENAGVASCGGLTQTCYLEERKSPSWMYDRVRALIIKKLNNCSTN